MSVSFHLFFEIRREKEKVDSDRMIWQIHEKQRKSCKNSDDFFVPRFTRYGFSVDDFAGERTLAQGRC